MFPGMNPDQMKKLMQQMGIKNTEVKAKRVIIESDDGNNLVVENPQVIMIEMTGQKMLQVMGEMHEEKTGQNSAKKETEKSDVEIVMEKTNCTKEQAEKALKEANGDIAEAIMLIQE